MSDSLPTLSLRTPPRYGRRAVLSALAALVLVGISFCVDFAASNQVGYTDLPAKWTLYLAGVALYYAAICLFLWFRQRRSVDARTTKKDSE